MPKEIEAFIPVLRETYRLITIYQFNRIKENETNLRLQITQATNEMQKFKPYIQRRWQAYIEVLENQHRFSIGDVICALDFAIHQMHLSVGNQNLTRDGSEIDALTPWGKEVKEFLDERRKA